MGVSNLRSVAGYLHSFFWFGARPETSISARYANRDLIEGAKGWRIWWRLGWHDIRQRYQRTVLGPFWITISMSAMVGGLALVFSAIFHNRIEHYVPFLGAGLMVWGFVSAVGADAPMAFVSANNLIRSIALPLTTYVCRVVVRNLIVFGHNLLAFVIIAVVLHVPVTRDTLLVVPGIVLLALNAVWVSTIIGIVGARYRDIQQIVSIALQLLFYLTPIIWDRSQIKAGHLYWVDFNPFYHLVEIVRAPMLGHAPNPRSYIACLILLAGGSLASYFVFRFYRRRIAYWV